MIEYVAATGSTNADLSARLAAGQYVAEGSWLVTDRQTAGRGRAGRVWSDGSGNFMGSTIVHRAREDPAAETLALAVALAVHQTIDAIAPGAASLKWPNDIMIGHAKLAGILLERASEAIVVGIGVNLVSAPTVPDRPTIALVDLAPLPTRNAFADALAQAFDLERERWRSFGMAPIVRRWIAAAYPLGTPLIVDDPNGGPQRGSFAGLDDGGALLLRLSNGSLRPIRAGEVRLTSNNLRE